MDKDNPNSLYKTDSPLPGKQNNYETAYNEAAMKLSSRAVEDVAGRSGATVTARGAGHALILPFIGDEVMVTHPDISVSYTSGKEEVAMWAKILILHYLVRAGGSLSTGEQVTFQQLEGGLAYYPAFQRRSIAIMIDRFGNSMEGFTEAGIRAGGRRAGMGDYALSFRALPRVEVLFVLWKGDNEFPSSGSIIFDSSISDYLSTEDVAVLCNMLAVKIVKTARPAI
jgi:hypothetical protein